jgi:hypothetical protein
MSNWSSARLLEAATFVCKEQFMIQRGRPRQQQNLCEPSGQQQMQVVGTSRLLRRHPVLLPVILLSGSLGLCCASFYATALFPLLALLGAPTSALCLSMAIVLGISGLLASIISSIEGIERYRLRVMTFAKSKGA